MDWSDIPEDEENYRAEPHYSLRDPDNFPRASFYASPQNDRTMYVSQPFGHGNNDLHSKYIDMISEWAGRAPDLGDTNGEVYDHLTHDDEDWEGDPRLVREANKTSSRTVESAWADVQNKAVRLLRDGKATVLLNRPTIIMGHVVGDHGEYDTQITRTDPNSSVIEQWDCSCPWSQYAWGRTRKWKRLEGRPCAHVLSLYWAAKSHPLDVADQEEGYQAPRGQRTREFTEDEIFDRGKGQLTEQQADLGIDLAKLPRSFSPDDKAPPITSLPDARQQIEQQMPAQPASPIAPRPANPFAAPKQTGPRKPGQDHLKLFDITAPPGGQPVLPTSPVSIPGKNPAGWENPTNPTQFPGTYSSVSEVRYSNLKRSEFHWSAAPDIEAWYALQRKGNTKAVFQLTKPVALEVRGGKIPVPGAVPIGESQDGIPKYRTLDLGWHPELEQRVNADHGPHGAPEARDQFADLHPGRRGEVVGIEPLLKMVRVHIPLNDVGRLHPHIADGWISYDDIAPLTSTGTPFSPQY
jgi:hypothetical protein